MNPFSREYHEYVTPPLHSEFFKQLNRIVESSLFWQGPGPFSLFLKEYLIREGGDYYSLRQHPKTHYKNSPVFLLISLLNTISRQANHDTAYNSIAISFTYNAKEGFLI